MTQDTTPTSGAADLPEALRRSTAADGKTELFNLPGYPLMVRAVDFNRLHTESEMRRTALLDEMQKATLAAEPDPTPGDHPQPCDSELFESGVSVGLFDMPKWTAEALCKGIAAATGARVDWHYIGGRVHVKALPAPTSAEGVAYAALPDERAAFEAQFPVPGGVHWDGTEYVVKDSHVSSYRCNRFEGQWEAWKARASHGQAPAQPDPAARPAQEAEPLLDYAMQIAHERELRVTGFPHDEDGAKRVFEAAVMRHTATGAAQTDSVQEDAARESEYRRGYRHGYEQRDAEVRGAMA